MWWTLIAQVAGQALQNPQLPNYTQQPQQSDWPIILGAVAGLGVVGYVAFRVLK